MTKIWLYLITFYFARETVLHLHKRPTGFDGHLSTIALSDSGDLKMKSGDTGFTQIVRSNFTEYELYFIFVQRLLLFFYNNKY